MDFVVFNFLVVMFCGGLLGIRVKVKVKYVSIIIENFYLEKNDD